MPDELIDHVEVYHTKKIDGVHVQKLIIHYSLGIYWQKQCAQKYALA